MMVELLASDGHEVVAVANGRDLLDELEVSLDPELGSGRFDLVISDIRMPGLTGLHVFSQIGYGPDVPPVVFITTAAIAVVRTMNASNCVARGWKGSAFQSTMPIAVTTRIPAKAERGIYWA
jgi:CheY-like chemotaxis protein